MNSVTLRAKFIIIILLSVIVILGMISNNNAYKVSFNIWNYTKDEYYDSIQYTQTIQQTIKYMQSEVGREERVTKILKSKM
jgi:hypothetical protein